MLKATRRVVGIPAVIIPAFRDHLAAFVRTEAGAPSRVGSTSTSKPSAATRTTGRTARPGVLVPAGSRHINGTEDQLRRAGDQATGKETSPDLRGYGGAGDGNRNRMTSLEGWGSTIELRPRAAPTRPGLRAGLARHHG